MNLDILICKLTRIVPEKGVCGGDLIDQYGFRTRSDQKFTDEFLYYRNFGVEIVYRRKMRDGMPVYDRVSISVEGEE